MLGSTQYDFEWDSVSQTWREDIPDPDEKSWAPITKENRNTLGRCALTLSEMGRSLPVIFHNIDGDLIRSIGNIKASIKMIHDDHFKLIAQLGDLEDLTIDQGSISAVIENALRTGDKKP